MKSCPAVGVLDGQVEEMPLRGGLAGEEPPDSVPAVRHAARHQGCVTFRVNCIHNLDKINIIIDKFLTLIGRVVATDLLAQVLPLEDEGWLHSWTVQEEEE